MGLDHYRFLYHKNILTPDLLLDLFEERAAIIEEGEQVSRGRAETLAAECYGFRCKTSLVLFAEKWSAIQNG